MPFKAGVFKLSHPQFSPTSDGGLTELCAALVEKASCSGTTKGHLRMSHHHHDWANRNGLCPQPGWVPAPTALDWSFCLAWCHSQGNAAGTCRSGVSAIAWHPRNHHFEDPTKTVDGRQTPLVAATLKGIARQCMHTKRKRRPLTLPLLRKVEAVFAQANPDLSDHDVQAYLTLYSTGIFALLRASEQSTTRTTNFDPKKHLLGRDVTFTRNHDGTATEAHLCIKAAKERPYRDDQVLTIHASVGDEHCPVKKLDAWARVRTGGGDRPFYQLSGGDFITRARLTDRLRAALRVLGLRDLDWASHSMRIGGAVTMAASTDMSSELLSIAGRRHPIPSHYVSRIYHLRHSDHATMSEADITKDSLDKVNNRFAD